MRAAEGRTACFGSCSPCVGKVRLGARWTASWRRQSLAKRAAALEWMGRWRPLVDPGFRGKAKCS